MQSPKILAENVDVFSDLEDNRTRCIYTSKQGFSTSGLL